MVIVPSASGLMGIMPSHAPTVAQLRPGVLEVHDGGSKESYFVSSGFAFVRKDRTDVCAVEAVKLDDVDADAVKKGLAECEAAVISAKDDLERAEAQIGVDVYLALNGAISMK
jgi:F-type H+-transporting ATPase subunit delta